VHVANNISHTENLQTNGSQYISPVYKIADGIQVTRVATYCCERHGYQVLNDSTMLIKQLDFESSLELPREMPIQHTITPPQALLYPQPNVPLVLTTPALASYASTHFRSAFAL
jgi:hypothetical protein